MSGSDPRSAPVWGAACTSSRPPPACRRSSPLLLRRSCRARPRGGVSRLAWNPHAHGGAGARPRGRGGSRCEGVPPGGDYGGGESEDGALLRELPTPVRSARGGTVGRAAGAPGRHQRRAEHLRGRPRGLGGRQAGSAVDGNSALVAAAAEAVWGTACGTRCVRSCLRPHVEGRTRQCHVAETRDVAKPSHRLESSTPSR
jgi:hypothetical protein